MKYTEKLICLLVLTVLFCTNNSVTKNIEAKDTHEKIRVLYLLASYPQLGTTYIHSELETLWKDYDIKIIHLRPARLATTKSAFPHELVPEDNRDRFREIISEFKPDVIHTHLLKMAAVIAPLAEEFEIPFTVRTHSTDVMALSPTDLNKQCKHISSKWCARVLCFPALRDTLIANGVSQEKVVSCWSVLDYDRFYNPDKRVSTNKVLHVGEAISKKNHKGFINWAKSMENSTFTFNLYIMCYKAEKLKAYNKKLGNPVDTITWVEPKDMPEVYRDHDWLVYMADKKKNAVGLPIGIAEAQASGIGVCWQELPGRREEQLEYLGGAGFLFKSIDEVADIISQPYPEEMRLRGYENAKKCDIKTHKTLLTEVWDNTRKH